MNPVKWMLSFTVFMILGIAAVVIIEPARFESLMLADRPAATPADSARSILQKYADAWRGREELALDGDLVVAF